jgi:hypothetical protein
MSENSGNRTFRAGEDLAAHRLVKIKSGTTTTPPEVVYADSDENFIGVTKYPMTSGDSLTIRFRNVEGSVELEAGEAFDAGIDLFTANDGKVVDTDPGSGTARVHSLEAATAAGDIIECLIR